MGTLVRLLPDQIGDNWDVIANAIRATTKDCTGEKLNSVLESALLGLIHCWVSWSEEGVDTVLITTVVSDTLGVSKNLLLHTAHGFAKLDGKSYVEMYETISNYAKSLGCEKIIFYTSNEKLCDLVKRHGGFVGRFVSIPV